MSSQDLEDDKVELNWGTELWDQFENLSAHTSKTIDHLERYGHFIRDRASIENEYASRLRRLVKSYLPKKKEEEDYTFTSFKAFKMMMNEVNDMAGQREVVSEDLQVHVIREVNILVKDIREERKKILSEGHRLSQNLQAQIEQLQRARKAYERAFRENEKALDNFQKADADLNLSRADVEKQRANLAYKTQMCDTAKNEYAVQLQKTNELQRQHFRSGLPEVFRKLQELEEKRIRSIRNFITSSVLIERNVFPIIDKCLEGILKAAEVINEKEDTLLVIEKFKSGFSPPEDFPFEDLSRGGASCSSSGAGGSTNDLGGSSSTSTSANNINLVQQQITSGKIKDGGYTVKGTITGKALKKRAGIFNIFTGRGSGNGHTSDGHKEDMSDLPPNQRRKKLTQKVEEIKSKIVQETAAKDGLMKMKGVYEANPALGDPMTVEGQLNECSHRLDKLHAELKRFQTYLEDALSRTLSNPQFYQQQQKNQNNSLTNSPNLANGGGLLSSASNSSKTRQHRHSGGSNTAGEDDPESLSRSASDSSVGNAQQNNHSNGQNHHGNGVNNSGGTTTTSNSNNVSQKRSAPGTPQLNHGCSNSPESGLGTSHTSLPGSDPSDQYDGHLGGSSSAGDPQDPESEYYEAEMLPAIGTCKALYPFEATSEGSIPMNKDEELHLIELDQGDGWTRVRRLNDQCEEGFVPTSYIEPLLFNT